MTRWYRTYEGTVTDAKLGEVALVAGCSRSVAIAAWHCILESCASTNGGGRFDTTPRRVAVVLGEPVNVIEAVFAEMESLGMISEGVVLTWKKRQFESDSSSERSRKHREVKRNGGATLQDSCATLDGRDATPPYTYTDTEKNKKEPREQARAVADEFEARFWKAWPNKVGKPAAEKSFVRARKSHSLETIMTGLQRYIDGKPPDRQWLNPATFLNQERFCDEPATAVRASPVQQPPPRKSYLQIAAELNARDAARKPSNERFDEGPGTILDLDRHAPPDGIRAFGNVERLRTTEPDLDDTIWSRTNRSPASSTG